MKKVAIQGTLGSYHDIAAHKYFEGEEIELICCGSFEDVFAAVKKDSQTIGMLAIENTIAGSLLHNNELLRQSGTQIVGEYKLRISHSFVCLPDEDWDDITEVNSHPIALMQCREFLSQHPKIKVVEGEDTALSAEIIKTENLKGHAAICSKAAAERYGMKVLQEGIETNKHNFTRFLVVADPWQVDELNRHRNKDVNKASMVFTLPHTEGSLSQVLSILSFYNINLTKIQSLPIIGREWEYQFYVDVAFDNVLRYKQSIAAISPLTKELKILGEYEDGKSNI
ncbi:prephenate dehydratase [Bacteroides sp. GD17]|jgi:prephenate dehydratase|uniref:prephenate dehydratase n=1 Tax=Bacteroides sp. GD17 TaxID=3139826 RepID=UPI0026006D26|nr:prephenate dehydratase [uncultured Bacteroides sp.]